MANFILEYFCEENEYYEFILLRLHVLKYTAIYFSLAALIQLIVLFIQVTEYTTLITLPFCQGLLISILISCFLTPFTLRLFGIKTASWVLWFIISNYSIFEYYYLQNKLLTIVSILALLFVWRTLFSHVIEVVVGGIYLGFAIWLILINQENEKMTEAENISKKEVTDFKENTVLLLLIIRVIISYSLFWQSQSRLSWIINKLHDAVEEKKTATTSTELFFNLVTHSLHTPLANILGCLDLMEMQTIGSDPIRGEEIRYLIKIGRTSGEILNNQLQNLIDVQQIQIGEISVNPRPGELGATLGNVKNIGIALAQQKSLFFKYIEASPMPRSLVFDAFKLQQILLNLITNSCKYVDKGGIFMKVQWIESAFNPRSVEMKEFISIELLNSSREGLVESVDEIQPSEVLSSGPLTIRSYASLSNIGNSSRSRGSSLADAEGHELKELGVGNRRKSRNIIPRSECLLQPPTNSYSHIPSKYSKRNYIASTHKRSFDHHECSSFGSNRQRKREVEHRFMKWGVLKIEIIDTGKGIKESELAHIFQPFMSHTENPKGCGMGLWISKTILNKMNAQIQVETRMQNGCNFIIGVPLEIHIEESSNLGRSLFEDNTIDLKGLSCLLVEDDIHYRELIRKILRRQSVEVHTANNGVEGYVEYTEKESGYFDVIITDLRMPLITGELMIQEIRKYEKTKNERNTPIIVMTGDPNMEERQKCLDILGVSAFLVKPIRHNILKDTIARVVGLRDWDPSSSSEGEDFQGIDHPKYNISSPRGVIVLEHDDLSAAIITKFIKDDDTTIFTSPIIITTIYKTIQTIQTVHDNLNLVIIGNPLDGKGQLAAKKIRQLEKRTAINHKINIITLGNEDEVGQKLKYRGLDVQGYLVKPLTREKVHTCLLNLP